MSDATKEYLEMCKCVKKVQDNHYKVKIQTGDETYDVMGEPGNWFCTCKGYKFGKKRCKHVKMVDIVVEVGTKTKETTLESLNDGKICCKHCGTLETVKNGIRPNKNYDNQKYYCKICEVSFSGNVGFEGLAASPEHVTDAIHLHLTGSSLSEVVQFLAKKGVKVGCTTIHDWTVRYVKLMDEYISTLAPQIGEIYHADEVWFEINGKLHYLFAMLDRKTRFWLGSQVGKKKNKAQVNKLFKEAEKIAQKTPSVLITDGAACYEASFKKIFAKAKSGKSSIHIREIHMAGDHVHNNEMESFNGKFRHVEQKIKGFKNAFLIRGIRIHYNYIRPHMGLNSDTPADRAGIIIKGANKWRTLILNAVKTLYNFKFV